VNFYLLAIVWRHAPEVQEMPSVQSPRSPRLKPTLSVESRGRRALYFALAGIVSLLAFLFSWPNLFHQVFTSRFMPHSYCYLGNSGLVWSHVVTDTLIGVSYLAISITLATIVYRGRQDIPFHWMFLAFGVFIVACGLTHFMEVVTVWDPIYVFSAIIKGFTAAASVTTAIALPFIVPEILTMVHRARESGRYLKFLETGLSEKEAAQGELRRLNELLEIRIRERTVDLARANAELEATAEQYRLLFHANPAALWVFDRETLRFLMVNEAAIRHYGYSQGEFLSMTIADIRPEEDVPRLLDSISENEMGLSQVELWRHRKKDGSLIDVEVTSHVIAMDGKNAVLVQSHDVTAQRKYEENLRQSEERFAKAFRSSPIAISISTENEGAYLDANDTFFKMMGYEREEIIGRTSQELGVWFDPHDRAELMLQIGQSRAKDFETRFRTKSGEERQVRISGERILLKGRPCLLANTLDVTESRRLEEQFRQAQKMEAVGRLAGGVAHDFNNLLSVMIGYSELAQLKAQPDALISGDLNQIKKAAEKAVSLTRQLLAFSRQQVLEPRILNLNTVVHNLSQMLLRLVGEDVSLVLKPTEPLGSVRADLGQIEQVLMNLVVNARDAMPQGGKIVIETANVDLDDTYRQQHPSVEPGWYVMLSLSDTGCGMDAKTVAKIFEPFFTTKPAGKGTGLGLSTVYGIVKQSGGHVFAYSETGHGATFKIYFPRVDRPAEEITTPNDDSAVEGGTETILLAEDDSALRALVAGLLTGVGYTVLEAADGNEAMSFAEEKSCSIDLLLTDVIMPGMSGGDLSVRLRDIRPKAAILFMSGYAGDLIVHAGVPESERSVLTKPFTRKSLLNKVRSILDRRLP
jgi:two-component system cell cycle sensor histidine kinase/response regulator CckA